MPVFSFVDIPDADDFSPIPAGKYLARYEHRETTVDNGVERWAYNMVVLSGDHAGRKVKDQIMWPHPSLAKQDTKKMAMLQRTKLVLSRLGLDMSQAGQVNYQPEHLEGRRAVITVTVERFTVPSTGEEKPCNKIPFAGYERPEQAAAPPAATHAAHTAAPGAHEAPVYPPAHQASAQAHAPTASPAPGTVQQPDFGLDDLPF